MGWAPMGVAGAMGGRDFIGIVLEQGNVDVARLRIDWAKSQYQPTLFD